MSWRMLDGHCHALMGSGWLLIFHGGLWMVADILLLMQHAFQQTRQPMSSCVNLWSSPCALMRGTVALLAANVVANLRPQQRPLAQENDPCLCGYMKNRCTSVSLLADRSGTGGGQLQDHSKSRAGGGGAYVVASHSPSPWWTCTTCEWPRPRWTCTTCHLHTTLLLLRCQLTPRLTSMLYIRTACSTHKTPPCSPCPVHTFWHIASLKLKEIFGTR